MARNYCCANDDPEDKEEDREPDDGGKGVLVLSNLCQFIIGQFQIILGYFFLRLSIPLGGFQVGAGLIQRGSVFSQLGISLVQRLLSFCFQSFQYPYSGFVRGKLFG